MSYNFQLFLNALKSRGIQCTQLSGVDYFMASFEGHDEYIFEIGNAQIPIIYFYMLNDKMGAKSVLMRHEFSVPKGADFLPGQWEDALEYARSIGYPVVAKATTFSKGVYVYPGIQSEAQFHYVWHHLLQKPHEFSQNRPIKIMVEEHMSGWTDYRFLVFRNHSTIIAKRLPPAVIGDGVSTIAKLIEIENAKRNQRGRTCSSIIYIEDADGERCLKDQGLTVSSVLKNGEKKFVRYNANETYGGTCEIVRDSIDVGYIKCAESIFSKFPRMDFLAIDFLIQDITKPCNPSNYKVLEFATYPGFSIFTQPTFGEGVDIFTPIIDQLFPETKVEQ